MDINEKTDCALVFKEDTVKAYMPRGFDEMEYIPPHIMLAMALFNELQDEDFQQDICEKFMEGSDYEPIPTH